jgi:hypothetical protein
MGTGSKRARRPARAGVANLSSSPRRSSTAAAQLGYRLAALLVGGARL